MSDYGGLISSVIGLGSDIGNMFLQKGQNRRNRKAMAEENARNRQFAQDMAYTDWLRFIENRDFQTEYNDPKNVMSRLKNAGINPHLAYDNGTGMSAPTGQPGSTSVPVGQAYQGKAPQMNSAGLMAGVQNAMLLDAQIGNIKADTQQKLANAKNTNTVAGINAMELENKSIEIPQQNEIRDIQIKSGKEQINLTQEQVNKTKSEIINLASQNEEINARIGLIATQRQYTAQQTANLVATLSTIWATYKNIQASTENIKASTSNIEQETRNKQELLKKYERENAVGEKYDMSNAEHANTFNDANAKKAFNLVKGSDLDNKMKDLKLTEQEYINTMRLLETVGSGVDLFKKAIPKPTTPPPPSARTTTRFDNQGNYSGHTTTRSHD